MDGVRYDGFGFEAAGQQELFFPRELFLLDLARQPHEPLSVSLRVIINWREGRWLSETSVR